VATTGRDERDGARSLTRYWLVAYIDRVRRSRNQHYRLRY